jgi:hypothetical protein
MLPSRSSLRQVAEQYGQADEQKMVLGAGCDAVGMRGHRGLHVAHNADINVQPTGSSSSCPHH